MSKIWKIVISALKKNKGEKGDREWVPLGVQLPILISVVKAGLTMIVTFKLRPEDSDRMCHELSGRGACQMNTFGCRGPELEIRLAYLKNCMEASVARAINLGGNQVRWNAKAKS